MLVSVECGRCVQHLTRLTLLLITSSGNIERLFTTESLHSVLRSNISEPGALKQKPLITHRVDKVMTIEKAEPVVFTPFTRCKIIQIQHLQK